MGDKAFENMSKVREKDNEKGFSVSAKCSSGAAVRRAYNKRDQKTG